MIKFPYAFNKKNLLILLGLLFVSSANLDPLYHDIRKTFTLNNESKMNLSIFGKNLLDEVARNHSSFVKNQVPLPGRNYGVKLKVIF